jgi:hypothetical protein
MNEEKERRTSQIQVMVTKSERDRIMAFFKKRGMALSAGARMVLIDLINKESVTGPGYPWPLDRG